MVMIHVYSQSQTHHLNCAVLGAQERNGGGLLPWPPLSPSCLRFSLSNLFPYFRSRLRKSHIPASFFFSHIRPPILFTQFLFLCFFSPFSLHVRTKTYTPRYHTCLLMALHQELLCIIPYFRHCFHLYPFVLVLCSLSLSDCSTRTSID